MARDIEDDVRTMLERRAGDVQPSSDAFEAIMRRVQAPQPLAPVVPLQRRPRFPVGPLLAAAVLAVVVATVGVVLATGDGDGDPVVAAPAVGPQFLFEGDGSAPEVTQAFLDDRLAAFDLGDRSVQAGEAKGAQVSYLVDRQRAGTVTCQQIDGGWGVVEASSDDFTLEDVRRTGQGLAFDVAGTTGGTLRYRVVDAEGRVVEEDEINDPVQGEDLRFSLPDTPAAAVLQVVFDTEDGSVSYVEQRIAPPPGG